LYNITDKELISLIKDLNLKRNDAFPLSIDLKKVTTFNFAITCPFRG
jgi:hypothetical protein